jgi:hypothetical protein
MAKIRKQRAKVASPSEVISTTVGLLTPQQGQEIKSTIIKYQNLKQGGRVYDHVKECLECLEAFHQARYNLQQANYALQMLLDKALVERGELSKRHHWKFKLVNKKYDPNNTGHIVAADLYCWDTPDEDFTTKLPAYLPREQADKLELGFLDLGDINDPNATVSEDTPEGTSEGTAKSTNKLATLFEQNNGDLIKEWDKAWNTNTSWNARLTYYRNNVAPKDQKEFLRHRSETERSNIRQHARADEKDKIQSIIDELNAEEARDAS